MNFRFFGQFYSVRIWRVVGWTFFALVSLAILSFVWRIGVYYHAIKTGASDPRLDRQIESSASRLRANANVSAVDLQRLVTPDAPTLGSANAPLTIVEFVDFGCPFCQATALPLRRVVERYKDKIRLVVRHFPIDDLHPQATQAAHAAACAHAQGKFWPMYDRLYTYQNAQSDADLMAHAQAIGMNLSTFQDCFAAKVYQKRIEQDITDGLQVGVEGTPSFFFNGIRIQGALDEDILDHLVQKFLTGKM